MIDLKTFRSWPAAIRWLHTYVSVLGFATLLLFAVTGLTLNHASYFEGEGVARELEGEMPRALLGAGPDGALDQLAIAAWLRAQHGLSGSLSEFVAEPASVSVVFKGPGYGADAEIDRASAKYRVTETRHGALAVLDDLHKGRDSGAAWSFVIDASAVVVAISAATGLWLLFYVRNRRGAGLVLAVLGTLALIAVGFAAAR